jgi:hypothetical protein
VTALVRIGPLRASGYDRAVGGAAAPEELDVYLGAQQLAREGRAVPFQGTVVLDPRLLQDTYGVGAGGLDRVLGLLDVGDLLLRLGPSQAVEEFAVGREGDAARAQFAGTTMGEFEAPSSSRRFATAAA